jgi:hypothetical protein
MTSAPLSKPSPLPPLMVLLAPPRFLLRPRRLTPLQAPPQGQAGRHLAPRPRGKARPQGSCGLQGVAVVDRAAE